jgi:hypothetical protein
MSMSEALDELTFDYEADGVLVRKQLDRAVLSHRGGWATVMFRFQERDAAGAFRAPKVALVRFQKAGDGYRKHSMLTLSTAEQARQVAEVLARWTADAAHEDAEDE